MNVKTPSSRRAEVRQTINDQGDRTARRLTGLACAESSYVREWRRGPTLIGPSCKSVFLELREAAFICGQSRLTIENRRVFAKATGFARRRQVVRGCLWQVQRWLLGRRPARRPSAAVGCDSRRRTPTAWHLGALRAAPADPMRCFSNCQTDCCDRLAEEFLASRRILGGGTADGGNASNAAEEGPRTQDTVCRSPNSRRSSRFSLSDSERMCKTYFWPGPGSQIAGIFRPIDP